MLQHMLRHNGYHEAAVAFIGNSDPWSDVKKVADLSEKQNVKIHIYEGANHSLETKSVRDNLDILKDVMEKTSRYMEESKYERY